MLSQPKRKVNINFSFEIFCFNENFLILDDHHHRQHPGHHSNHCDCNTNTTTTTINDLDSETEFLTRHPEANQNLPKRINNIKIMKCSESNKMLADHIEAHTIEDPEKKAEINNKVSKTISS